MLTQNCYCWYHFPHLSHHSSHWDLLDQIIPDFPHKFPHFFPISSALSFHHRSDATFKAWKLRPWPANAPSRIRRTTCPSTSSPRSWPRTWGHFGGGKKGRWTCTTVLCIYIYVYIYRYKYIHTYIYTHISSSICGEKWDDDPQWLLFFRWLETTDQLRNIWGHYDNITGTSD